MFIQALIDIAFSMLSYLVALFPTADNSLITFLNTNYLTLRTDLAGLNSIVDIPSLFLILSAFIAIEGALMLFKFTKWVIANISAGIFKK